jgi:hypothetical protein
MPPEQENINHQIEALQRYVSDLQTQRERGELVRRPRPAGRLASRWPLATAALVVGALLGGVAVGVAARSEDRPAGAFAATTATSLPSAPAATPQCRTAVERANRSLAIAVKVEESLAEHTEYMNDLLNGKIDGEEALRLGTPSLVMGAAESAKFDIALADYRQVVKQCRLATPPAR